MNQTLGQRIFNLRKQKHITQEAMAEQLGVSPQAVSKWENDNACPDIMLLPSLAKLLGATVDELLSGEKKQEVMYLPEEKRKDLDKMVFRILILSCDGDKVKINLPIPLIRLALQMGVQIPQLQGKLPLQEIDLNQLMELVEKGVIGKLVEIESADGDIIEIVVE